MTRAALPLLAVLAAAAVSGPAWARDPEPKPSGVVIHLFGPQSVTSNLVPVTPSGATNASGASGTPASAASPALGDVLHQMFVTGDPTLPPAARISKGKSGSN
jgi:hypothetical protein